MYIMQRKNKKRKINKDMLQAYLDRHWTILADLTEKEIKEEIQEEVQEDIQKKTNKQKTKTIKGD